MFVVGLISGDSTAEIKRLDQELRIIIAACFFQNGM